jgi:hypothetical protein
MYSDFLDDKYIYSFILNIMSYIKQFEKMLLLQTLMLLGYSKNR